MQMNSTGKTVVTQGDFHHLVAATLALFSSTPLLCGEGTNAPIQNPPSESLITDAIHGMDFLGGIVSLNPFQTGSPPFTITNNSTALFGTVQVNNQDRWALDAHTNQSGSP
jgi:hypothetical protein